MALWDDNVRPVSPIKSAVFTAENVDVTDACSGLLSSCTRVVCTARNTGNAPGMARATLIAIKQDDTRQEYHEDVVASPGQQVEVAHDFKRFDGIRGECRLDPL